MTREDELIRKMEQGETGAADELVEMFYADILRYCVWHAPNRSLAEDAVQETFLKVIRYFDRYVHRGRFKAFLYKTAANTCADMRRKSWMSDVPLEEVTDDFVCSESDFEQAQSDMVMRQLISGLSVEVQEIVLLRFGQDLTIREIAEVVNMPLRTVQSRLRSALKKLKIPFCLSGRKPAKRGCEDALHLLSFC